MSLRLASRPILVLGAILLCCFGACTDPANIATLAGATAGSTGSSAGVDTVMKVGVDGGTPTTLASGQTGAIDVAVDATRVYWVNSGDTTIFGPPESTDGGTVMKLAK